MKFITMKYGLNGDSFVVDVIYKGDIIPEDYTLIDVAYYYKWEKNAPMQFFYRIFKKNKVLLKRRKRKSRSEDKISDGKKPRPVECTNNTKSDSNKNTINEKLNADKSKNDSENNKNGGNEIIGCRTVSNSNPPALQDETKKETIEKKDKKNEPVLPPPTLKPITAKKEEKMEESSDDDDKPPSEKKLKIDESSDVDTIKKVETKSELPMNKKEEKDIIKAEEAKPKPVLETKVIKPKLTSASNSTTPNKPRNHMLTDIVNNLAKKQLGSLNNKTNPKSTPVPPSTLLGGQTTITKKDNVNKKEETKNTKKLEAPKRDINPKGVPSGTSVTVKSMLPSSASSSTSPTTVSFSNSFKSKNGSNSMMNFVQASTPNTNGLSPSKKAPSSTLSDLRQFRKEPTKTTSGPPTTSRSPIIPSLTSRTLTLGNSKIKTSTATSSPICSSAFSGVLSKPLPKPGEASSSANSFLAQANNLSALAALGLGMTEEQKAFFRNMAAAALLPPPITLPSAASVTQQLPSNRLKLTVQTSKSNSITNPLQMMPPTLASHMAPESQWKMFSPLAGTGHHHHPATNGKSGSSSASKYMSKNLNQSIRQIPNPSLLTKQASDQRQQQLLQRAIASQVAAAASVAAANARTSLSQ